MGLLDWVILSMPDSVTPADRKTDEGVIARVLQDQQRSANRAEEREAAEEAEAEQEAEEVFEAGKKRAEQAAGTEFERKLGIAENLKAERAQIALQVMDNRAQHAEQRQAERQQASEPTAFDTWLVKPQTPDIQAGMDAATLDYILNPPDIDVS